MATLTSIVEGHKISISSPTVYSKVLRQVLLNKLETGLGKPLIEATPLTRDLSYLFSYLFAQIKLIEGEQVPAWFADDTYTPEAVYAAFIAWCELPESAYDQFNALYGQVSTPPNPPHLQPDVTPENPT